MATMPKKMEVKRLALRVIEKIQAEGLSIPECAEAAGVSYAVIYFLVEEGKHGRRRMHRPNFDAVLAWVDSTPPEAPPPKTTPPAPPSEPPGGGASVLTRLIEEYARHNGVTPDRVFIGLMGPR
jgi:hypothetical protein